MTQEEKDLLLRGLCVMLPYGVKISVNDKVEIVDGVNVLDNAIEYGSWLSCEVEEVKPYLFSLSSMTEEQLFEVQEILGKHEIKIENGFLRIVDSDRNTISYLEILALLKWFYKNHFDVNNLIPMGLAIDCTDLNIY